ncbi:MAG: lytic transglycosylase domain-containing protein [Candidatus Micrarchaeaceae archaeon]
MIKRTALIITSAFATLLNISYAESVRQCIIDASYEYHVNPYILYAIAKVESDFNPYAINYDANGTVDYGMFQINSANLQDFGLPVAYAYNVCFSAKLAAYLLRQCMNWYGNTWRAIDCYNKGHHSSNSSWYIMKVYYNIIKVERYAEEHKQVSQNQVNKQTAYSFKNNINSFYTLQIPNNNFSSNDVVNYFIKQCILTA